MSRPKKISLILLFSGGLFVTVAGLLRMILIHVVSDIHRFMHLDKVSYLTRLQNPQTGAAQAAAWAIRETFVAIVVASLPMTWGWIQKQLGPIFGPVLGPLFRLDKRSRSDPQPGTIPLISISQQNLHGAWGIVNGGSVKTVVTHESQPDIPNNIFIHSGETSTDAIMPAHLGGIQKDVEFSVSTCRASVCNQITEPVQDAGPAYPRGTLAYK